MIKKCFKDRKWVDTLLLVLFVLCVTVSITLASLGVVTGERTNMFTGADNIRARLTEPNWNEAKGLSLVPGKVIRKDPMITNTGKIMEYVAIRLTFLDKNGETIDDDNLLRLINLLEISWSDKWTLCDETTMEVNTEGAVTSLSQPLIFYYQESLSAGEVSDPVFSGIRVKDELDGLTESDLRWLQGIKIEDGKTIADSDGISEFQIKIEGAAIQAQGFESAEDAADILKGLFPDT